MNAYEVFLVQTQPIVNCLYIVVICILPLLWLGECKRTMSLFFKRIRLPDLYDISHEQIEISNSFQILIITMGVIAYFLHRRWRNYVLDLRCIVLKQEIGFTDNKELNVFKVKLLQTINDNLIERKAKIGKCLYDEHIQEIDDIAEVDLTNVNILQEIEN